MWFSSNNMQPCLKYLLIYLRIAGLDPQRQNCTSTIMKLIFVLGFGFMIVPMMAELVLNFAGMETLSKVDSLPILLVEAIKFTCFVVNKDKFLDIIDTIQRLWPYDKFGSETHKRQLKIFRNTNIVLIASIIAMLFAFFGYMIIPLFQNIRDLPIPGYPICNLLTSPCYEILYTLQIEGILLQSMTVLLGFDLLFIILATYIYCSFEMVIIGFRNIDVRSNTANRQLGEVVEQHDIVLKFLMKVDGFYNMLLSLQFIGGAGQQIFNLYMLFREGMPPPMHLVAKYGVFYYVISSQMLVYCIVGTVLSEKTQQIAEEVFALEWWETSNVSLGRSLRFVMEVAQKSRQLTLGKIVNLDLMLFVEVVKTTTQIYILLNTVE